MSCLARVLVLLSAVFALAGVSQADSIRIEKNLSFGAITAHPKGDRIIINASAGTAVPVSQTGYSYIVNGSSGQLSFDSSASGTFLQVVYPDSLELRCQENPGKTLVIDDFFTNSTSGFFIQEHTQDIHIGGRLTINPNQYPCQYSGDLLIILAY